MPSAESAPQEPVPAQLMLVADENLGKLNIRPSLSAYLAEIIHWRHFVVADARSRAFKGNQEMFLGNLWLVLTPLLQSATYGLVFGLLLRTSRGIDNFVGYLVIGVIFFGFVSRGINAGSGLIQSSRSMIRSFTFPRATLVFGVLLRQFLDNLVPAMVAIAVALVFQWGEQISWSIAIVPLLYVLLHVFSCGLALVFARLTAFIPDLRSLMNFGTRVLFYVSGVFFSIERFATEPILQYVMTMNPIYQFLEAIREAVLYGSFPEASSFVSLVLWSVGSFCLGLLFFWQSEARYVRV